VAAKLRKLHELKDQEDIVSNIRQPFMVPTVQDLDALILEPYMFSGLLVLIYIVSALA
jgi:hypothetical protein